MKAKRQALIREIVEAQSIQTQEELAEALRAHGMVVTQATVSRDIREMHLLKVLAEDGSYRYATMEKSDSGMNDRLIRMLTDSVVEMNSANNLIVIHTLPGSAHVAAEAIDNLKWPETIGTIAGDNTILVIVRTNEEVDTVMKRFHSIIK
ncbi:MAG: arginine repressor [Clostridiales bacterium]|nr:arginine repressor [Clostridiales bacterium]MDY3764831.1 arginine repressor [Candidatus Ventricola sp.]MCI6587434.1 arginine repressor [Clostridiales bacterium]MCI7704030.1 arginine repressor [Clostridiales bacterium]MDY3832931.1 arginine repressor [Candidatus Ventricola sp.]